jgi:hypothetical protein
MQTAELPLNSLVCPLLVVAGSLHWYAGCAGYEGFLNPAAGRMRRSAIKQDDRLFSTSSVTGAWHLQTDGQS